MATTEVKTTGALLSPEFMASLKYLATHRVIVGWPAGSKQHISTDHTTGKTVASGLDIASLMTIHETREAAAQVGLVSRPVLAPTKARVLADGELPGILKFYLNDLFREKITGPMLLQGLGAWYARQVDATFDFMQSSWVPNAPATVALKGHDTILHDTGMARAEIKYKVRRA